MSHSFDPGRESRYYSVSDENLLANRHVRAFADTINATPGPTLDVGCGSGAFASLLSDSVEYSGFDFALAEPRQLGTSHAIAPGNACSPWPYPDDCFHYVVSFWCLEHLPSPRVALSELARVLVPGGHAFLVFPDYDSPLHRCPSWWCSKGDDDSLRHVLGTRNPALIAHNLARRVGYLARQLSKQTRLDLGGAPVFEVNSDPAYLHLPWGRDRDAIHVASGRSVTRELRALGLEARSLQRESTLVRLPVIGCIARKSRDAVILALKPRR